MAPEIMREHQRNGYDEKVDVWAMGVSCVCLLQGTPPYWDLEPLEMLRRLEVV